MSTHPKDGSIRCPEFLAWVRRQQCVECVERLEVQRYRIPFESEAHHYPPKGMGGARIRDDHTMPLCRRHHEQAQTYQIAKATQERWIHETRSAFLEECSTDELTAYFAVLEAWKDRPLECPF